MRLALLSPYTEPVIGGISSYTRELAAAYKAMGIECAGFANVGETNPGFVVLGPEKPKFCMRAISKLLRWKPDLVHAHSQHWYIALPSVVTKLCRPGTRLLFTFHTPVLAGSPGIGTMLLRFLVRLSDGVVFVSREMKETARLPTSVRQTAIVAAPESSATLAEGRSHVGKQPVVLFAGPLVWPRKVEGVLLLAEAFASVADTFPNWRLVILGDGPMKPAVEARVAELGIENRVALRGFVESVFEEVAGAEVYAQISLQEGLPISVLNAMALGTAVLATTVGGMPEVIRHGETGFLVRPQLEAVATGLKELMGNADLRRRLADSAREWVRRELSWQRVATEHLRFAMGTTP